MTNPYQSLPKSRFWKSGVVQTSEAIHEDIFSPKWQIDRLMKITTAGSCFAQHIASTLRAYNFNVIDYEPAPLSLSLELSKMNGYGVYSCRYGNIYTSRQLLQLAKEAFGSLDLINDINAIWTSDKTYRDAFRPTICVDGHSEKSRVSEERREHLRNVQRMLLDSDLLIFTLGLTEAWIDEVTMAVYPTAPGLIGYPERNSIAFKNLSYNEIYSDFIELDTFLKDKRSRAIRFLLTVSPVPLTATASGKHVLCANTYSKSVLRAVAGDLANNFTNFDYFPSFEIITNPASHGSFYENNLRTVRPEAVQHVMKHFINAYGIENKVRTADFNEDAQCEDALLEVFAPSDDSTSSKTKKKTTVKCFGDSHLAAFSRAYADLYKSCLDKKLFGAEFIPLNWVESPPFDITSHKCFTEIKLNDGYETHIQQFADTQPVFAKNILCIVGLNLMGNAIINIHGNMIGGWTNPDGSFPPGSEISPSIPFVNSVGEAEKLIKDKFLADLCYKRYFIERVAEHRIWDEIYWVTSPIMTEQVAKYRLTAEYVNSGSQNFYNEAAQRLFEQVFLNPIDNVRVITHSELSASGFTHDRFSPSPLPFDTHVAPKYFESIVAKIFLVPT